MKPPPALVSVPPDKLSVPTLEPLARARASQLLLTLTEALSWMVMTPVPPFWPTHSSPEETTSDALSLKVALPVAPLAPTMKLPTDAIEPDWLTTRVELAPPPIPTRTSPVLAMYLPALGPVPLMLTLAMPPLLTAHSVLPPPALVIEPPLRLSVPLAPKRPTTNQLLTERVAVSWTL